MKCRRNKDSRGARLRGTRAAAARAGAGAPSARQPPRDDLPAPTPRPTHSAERPSELRIDGHAAGPICHAGVVIVGPKGWVKGGITAEVIVIEGQVEGDLTAAASLRIGASARVLGDLLAPRVAVARGARLRGRLSTRPVPAAASDLDDRGVDQVLSGRV